MVMIFRISTAGTMKTRSTPTVEGVEEVEGSVEGVKRSVEGVEGSVEEIAERVSLRNNYIDIYV